VVYKNTFDGFYKIFKNEGWRAFYKGFGIVAAFTVPAHGLYFLGYEVTKRNLHSHKKIEEKGPFVHFTAGLVAEFFGALIWTPMDVVKQRLQLQKTNANQKYKNSMHAFLTIVKEEGFRGLFKGFLPGLATYGPFVGIYFVVYEKSKTSFKNLYKMNSVDQLPFHTHLIGGFLAGAVSAAVTCPLDVIKTRIQVQSKTSQVYKNGIHAFVTILKEEGISAFGKGMGARMLWIAPGTAITIAAYEQFKRLVGL